MLVRALDPNKDQTDCIHIHILTYRMALGKERISLIKAIDPNFIHEFFRAADKDSRAKLARTFDLTKPVQDGEFFLGDGTAVRHGRRPKGEFERQIQLGLLFRSDFHHIALHWSIIKVAARDAQV
jgi:hypothetical protein